MLEADDAIGGDDEHGRYRKITVILPGVFTEVDSVFGEFFEVIRTNTEGNTHVVRERHGTVGQQGIGDLLLANGLFELFRLIRADGKDLVT